MSSDAPANDWLIERGVNYVEMIVADFAGLPRGKIQPAALFGAQSYKLPFAIFGQTIDGTFHMRDDNVQDRDMLCRPDTSTLRLVPWAVEPTACVLMDCIDLDGSKVDVAPRAILQRVLALFETRGWRPVVAPEVEFYLQPARSTDATTRTALAGTAAAFKELKDPYGIDRLHDLGNFVQRLAEQCRQQDIALGAMSQELGAGQFEVNFEHGDPLKLADDVFHFKRTLKQVARAHGMRATFLAKLDSAMPGSSMHIHQSVYDAAGNNLFSDSSGAPSRLFEYYIGGLQQWMTEALLLFAPYPNSYRRFLSHWSSPVNLEWAVENRTVGLRMPNSPPEHRRVENRLAGSDVNPYLAIAASLGCGYFGMTRATGCRAPVEGSAYNVSYALHRHIGEAIDSFRDSATMRELLGDDFVALYCAVKELEFREFQERIPAWERDELALLV
jgi:glutamine synthetase